LDRLEIGREDAGELEVLADQALEQSCRSRDDGVQVDHAGVEYLLAAEREQLMGQVARAPARATDLLDLALDRMPVAKTREHEFAEALDRGHHVVEVVRDASGEPADGLHLLRVAELLLCRRERLGLLVEPPLAAP